MATRTNDLTDVAKPLADELYARLGSLKRVMSAGIVALADQKPAWQQYYMAKAIGYDLPRPQKTDAQAAIDDETAAANAGAKRKYRDKKHKPAKSG